MPAAVFVYEIRFQFLIGSLEAVSGMLGVEVLKFQFLIGSLEAKVWRSGICHGRLVSIPHR